MIAVDTNLLVYSHRAESPWHAVALACIRSLAEGRDDWAIPWPCIHEFLAIVTHARIYAPPTPLAKGLAQADAWLESPTLVLLGETHDHWNVLRGMLAASRVGGAQIHDARVAALCRAHGVTELWSADRDFGRFPELTVRNPLVSPGAESE